MSARQRPARQRPESSSPIKRLQSQPEPVRVGEQVRESTSDVTKSESSEVPKLQTSKEPKQELTQSGSAGVPESDTSGVSDSGSSDVPKYQTLERKDVRLRADQLDRLAQLTRQVSAARTARSERITENTLVRVAIDLLMSHSSQLRGNSEPELRDSVTSEVQKFGTSEDPR